MQSNSLDQEQNGAFNDKALETRLNEARTNLYQEKIGRRMFLFLAACSAIAGVVYALLPSKSDSLWPSFVAGFVAIFFGVLTASLNQGGAIAEIKDLEDEISLRQLQTADREEKAHKLLRIQQGQLFRYFDLVFQQSKGIYWIGVGSMALGFVIIGWAMYVVSSGIGRSPNDFSTIYEKGVVAVIGAIAGILTNYIGTIYLKMFSEIVQSVNGSVKALTISTNLNFANVLVANIDDQKLREEALKELATSIKNSS
jgi:hypothetical protein